MVLRGELDDLQPYPPPEVPTPPRQLTDRRGRKISGDGSNPTAPDFKRVLEIYKRNLSLYQVQETTCALHYFIDNVVECDDPPAWWSASRKPFYDNEISRKRLWICEQMLGSSDANDFIDAVLGQNRPVESEIDRAEEQFQVIVKRGESYQPASEYKSKKERKGGIIFNGTVQAELARVEMGYSPEVFYSLVGHSMWKEPGDLIPFTQSEIIAFSLIKNKGETIDTELSQEENKAKK